jgi:disulfide bond formation protein DsbB
MRSGFLRAEKIAMLTGVASLLLLLGALGFQYIGGLPPCEMCHWQRWAHIATTLFGLGGGALVARGVVAPGNARIFALLAIFFILVSGLIGAYQAGVQWHLLPGPHACTGPRYVIGSGAPSSVVRCDIASFILFGLSLAGYNAIFSLGAAVLAAFGLWRRA